MLRLGRLESRNDNKPKNKAIDMAAAMGIDYLAQEQNRQLHRIERIDTKTPSWLKTPAEIRKLGAAFFGGSRYVHVFVYHNGAQSYYASRVFHGWPRV